MLAILWVFLYENLNLQKYPLGGYFLDINIALLRQTFTMLKGVFTFFKFCPLFLLGVNNIVRMSLGLFPSCLGCQFTKLFKYSLTHSKKIAISDLTEFLSQGLFASIISIFFAR